MSFFKMLPTNYSFTNHEHAHARIYNYKHDLALNNLQWLICHKTQPTNQKIHLKFDLKI